MVEVVGIEPTKVSPPDGAADVVCKSGEAPSSPLASPNPNPVSPGLARIVASWAKLRPELQAAILAIVASAEGGTVA